MCKRERLKTKMSQHNPFAANDEEAQPLILPKKINVRAGAVCFITTCIMAVLIYGVINLYTNDTEIIYGTIGSYTFQIYYITHLGWYAIFLIIHLFMLSTQVFYTMSNQNYINHILLNYSHLRHMILLKILFIAALVVILILDNTPRPLLPLYCNLIVIEMVLASLLVLVINDVFLAFHTAY